ncbi:MAG: adenylate/guanylate cyclase domain-containing protein [Gordonia sp. (in: high G+C Gram-positive bacteria)]
MPGSAEMARCLTDFAERGIPDADERARRLITISSFSAAGVTLAFAVVTLVAGGVLTRLSLVQFVLALALALVPLTHRFGRMVSETLFVLTATAALCIVTAYVGTDSGLTFYFFVMAAASPMVVGVRRPALLAAVVAICIVAVVALYLLVPADTGRGTGWLMSGGFVVNVAVASILAVIVVGYGLRQIERAEAALEDQYARSEALLDNILPRSVADRLKEPGHTEVADAYDDASILFADIAGFTAMSSRSAPTDVVRFLDRLYSALDDLAQRHGLEKIKTTGDSYMVVSGVPEPRPDHLEALARFALEMREVCEQVHGTDGAVMPMRIGLAAGPVVAGVVGSRKFFYDVWGDAVNVASRMESTGVVGRIQVTQAVRDALAGRFCFEDRGIVQVKGKDDQHTWFLLGEK